MTEFYLLLPFMLIHLFLVLSKDIYIVIFIQVSHVRETYENTPLVSFILTFIDRHYLQRHEVRIV